MCGGGNDNFSYHEICKKFFKSLFNFLLLFWNISIFLNHIILYMSPQNNKLLHVLQFMKNKHI